MPDEPRRAVCAGCSAPVIWRFTPAGKRMPLDPDPVASPAPGTFRLEGEHRCIPAEPMFDPPGSTYYLAHWATCPQADQFKPHKETR